MTAIQMIKSDRALKGEAWVEATCVATLQKENEELAGHSSLNCMSRMRRFHFDAQEESQPIRNQSISDEECVSRA